MVWIVGEEKPIVTELLESAADCSPSSAVCITAAAARLREACSRLLDAARKTSDESVKRLLFETVSLLCGES